MNVRPRVLPPGWYPKTEAETREEIEEYVKNAREPSVKGDFIAGVAPHAGWFYSGKLACNVIKCLAHPCDTVVVVGGHLHPRSVIMAATEKAYYTPLGPLEADLPLLEKIRGLVSVSDDDEPDNTVEVQLPFVKYFFPNAKATYMRAPPSDQAIKLGAVIAQVAGKLNRKVVLLGSTDLTHYGPNYGWAPKGSGKDAVMWVKETNDKRFLDAVLANRPEEALNYASGEKSACSAGGAITALSFAQSSGRKKSTLLDYYTSYDVQPNSSFVGYAGILFF